MQTLSSELRGVIEKRVRVASPQEVFAIASALCAEEPVVATRDPKPTRFEVQGDVVVDHRTGLHWTRQNVSGGHITWAEAKKSAGAITLGGHTDWRLPTIRELLSLVDYENHDPAIDTSVFQCDSAWYWSSTPLASSPGDGAWVVGFDYGLASWGGQYGGGFVRACRPGQSLDGWF